MTITAEIKNNIVVPGSIQRKAGFRHGDRLEFKVSGKVITIVPEFPNADDEYTPKQRKIIDASLAKAMKGLHYGPFETHKDLIKFLHSKKFESDKRTKIKSKK